MFIFEKKNTHKHYICFILDHLILEKRFLTPPFLNIFDAGEAPLPWTFEIYSQIHQQTNKHSCTHTQSNIHIFLVVIYFEWGIHFERPHEVH